jgi:hypothetical protein
MRKLIVFSVLAIAWGCSPSGTSSNSVDGGDPFDVLTLPDGASPVEIHSLTAKAISGKINLTLVEEFGPGAAGHLNEGESLDFEIRGNAELELKALGKGAATVWVTPDHDCEVTIGGQANPPSLELDAGGTMQVDVAAHASTTITFVWVEAPPPPDDLATDVDAAGSAPDASD